MLRHVGRRECQHGRRDGRVSRLGFGQWPRVVAASDRDGPVCCRSRDREGSEEFADLFQWNVDGHLRGDAIPLLVGIGLGRGQPDVVAALELHGWRRELGHLPGEEQEVDPMGASEILEVVERHGLVDRVGHQLDDRPVVERLGVRSGVARDVVTTNGRRRATSSPRGRRSPNCSRVRASSRRQLTTGRPGARESSARQEKP